MRSKWLHVSPRPGQTADLKTKTFREGLTNDYGKGGRFAALVSQLEREPMENHAGIEHRLDVRRLRDLCADPHGRCCPAPTARALAICANSGLCRNRDRHHAT